MASASRCLHGDDVRDNLFEAVARLFYELGNGVTTLSLFLPYAPIPAHFRRNKVWCGAVLCGVGVYVLLPCPSIRGTSHVCVVLAPTLRASRPWGQS